MGIKLHDKYAEKVAKSTPGPGNYEAVANRTMRTAPSYGLGTEKRTAPGKKGISPDPGAYNPSINYSKPSAPGYKLGTQARESFDVKRSSQLPGPGNYELKSTFKGTEKPNFHMGIKLNDLSKM